MKKLFLLFGLIFLTACSPARENLEKTTEKLPEKTIEKKLSAKENSSENTKISLKNIVKTDDKKVKVKPEIPPSDLKLTSPDFQDGVEIPAKFTCDGESLFPTLNIEKIPAKTKSLVLIVSSPKGDLPKVVHGDFWDIPADTSQIDDQNLANFSSGMTDFQTSGYVAPCPPVGVKEDFLFEVWALDKNITNANPQWTAGHLMVNSLGHILGKSVLKISYQR